MCELVVAKMVNINCPIMFPNRITYVELVELDILDFYIIYGMDWLHARSYNNGGEVQFSK